MKICYVNKGISIHDQKFLNYLCSKDYDIHLLSFYKGDLPRIPDLKVKHISKFGPKLSFPIASIVIPKWIRSIKPDIVHGNYLLTYGFYAACAKYHPILQMAWGSDALILPKNFVYRQIIKYSLKHADLVTIDCETGKKELVKLGYPKDKIIVFPWGIDTNKFRPDIDVSGLKEKLGWANENQIVICTRSHKPIYGIEYLIKAIPNVIKKNKSARFLFIGDGMITKNLKQMTSLLKIEEYVKFIGRIPNEKLPKYLVASDIYVSPSLSDGTSVSLLEAMACGLPVVVTDIEAILEWVVNCENGFVVPKRDSNSLADKICALLDDKNLRKSFGYKNFKIARERATGDTNVKVLEGIYETLVKK